jgi:hypothetical protein
MKYIKLFEKYNTEEEYLSLLETLGKDILKNKLLNIKEGHGMSLGYGDWSLNVVVENQNLDSIRTTLKESKWINNIEENEGAIDFNFLPPYMHLKDEIFILFEGYEDEKNKNLVDVKIRIDN